MGIGRTGMRKGAVGGVVRGMAIALLLAGVAPVALAESVKTETVKTAPAALQPADIFELEYASDPQISPDGSRIVYARIGMDIMQDRRVSNLWILDTDGRTHRPLVSGRQSVSQPRWSPDGTRIAYVSSAEGTPQLYVRWMDTGATALVTDLTEAPGNIAWSPDGTQIAFTMLVPAKSEPLAKMPAKPEGAQWAPGVTVIDSLQYRRDGAGGFVEQGRTHLFVVPADGGTPRQLTSGEFDHGATPAWMPDGTAIVISANRNADWERNPNNSDLWEVSVADGTKKQLTTRVGPDGSPAVSPDGRHIAFVGYEDKKLGYHNAVLSVLDRQTGEVRHLTAALDREADGPQWTADGRALLFTFDDHGKTKLARVALDGAMQVLLDDLGGTDIGRPYPGGGFSLSDTGRFAYTMVTADRPADIAVSSVDPAGRGGAVTRLTALNDDLLGHRTLGKVEEIRYASSADGKEIQGWIVYPPGFDPAKKYPLLLEIHGGPFANYGPRFSGEMQLFASAGYVVLYTNPRGSTSYGAAFANEIHHNYPGQDYDDLMSGVDAVIAKGFIDETQLFITGGSGGGVLTAWTIGKTDRFRAAVVSKPVINWTSFALTADLPAFFWQYWFPDYPWNAQEQYWRRSPLSLVGNVKTPTMLLTGEADYRTPMSETEQYYVALKLRGIDTVMVRVPEAPHLIVRRPSHFIAKVNHIVAWFDKYRAKEMN